MVNRVIQQKIVKMKRMRRAHLKRFSTKGTGPIKYPGFFNERGEFVDTSLRSRTKAAAVQDLDSQLNEYLRRRFKFKLSDPESIYARSRGLHTDLTRDGEIILAKMVQSRAGPGTLQGEQRFVSKTYIDRPTRRLTLYMGGETNFFIEVRDTEDGTYIMRSSNYTDRARAVAAHLKDEILWDEITPPSELTNTAQD